LNDVAFAKGAPLEFFAADFGDVVGQDHADGLLNRDCFCHAVLQLPKQA